MVGYKLFLGLHSIRLSLNSFELVNLNFLRGIHKVFRLNLSNDLVMYSNEIYFSFKDFHEQLITEELPNCRCKP